MNKLRLGIIGPGNHAQENLLPAIRNVKSLEIYAIQSRNKFNAHQIAEEYQASRVLVTDDPAELLNDEKCDALVVSATPQVHQDILQRAIQKGKPVFVEKPPTADLKSLMAIKDKLVSKAEQPVIQFGFNFRYSDFYTQVEEMKQATGAIQYMKIKSYAAKPDTAMWHYDSVLASSLYAVHIHAIEMLCYTLGQLDDFKSSILWLDESKYVLTIMCSFANNKMGMLELSNASNRFEYDVECIDGDRNILRSEGFNHMTVFGPDFNEVNSYKPKSFITYNIPFLRGGFDRTGYSRQFEFFRDSINSHKVDSMSIDSCIDAYKIIEGVIHEQ